MKKFLSILFSMLFLVAYADGNQMTTVVTSGAVSDNTTAVILSNAVRAVWSKEIEFRALPNMRFEQFATVKTELGVQAGLTISMLTYDNLKMGGALTEGMDMTTQALSGSMKSLTVTEHGNGVLVSELAITASFDDIMDSAATALARDYAAVIDRDLRDAALTGTNRIYASKSDGTKVTSRANLDATCTLKVSTIKDALEILATNNAPMRMGNFWISFVHPHQSRGLRDDSAWIEASKYGAPDQLFTGEIGKIDNVRFIESTVMCNGAAASTDVSYKAELVKGNAAGSANTNVYQSVIFGQDYYGLATSVPVELRDSGVLDFGRKHGLAWYSIYGVGLLHNDYGVVIETA